MLYTINQNNHTNRPNGALNVDTNAKVIGFAPCFRFMSGWHIEKVKGYCRAQGWVLKLHEDTNTETIQ